MNYDKKQLERIYNKTIKNDEVVESNVTIWTTDLDNYLRELVLLYNFNFYDIAEKFQEIIALPYKYDFSDEEVARHWAFLHAARELRLLIDDEYYKQLRINRPKKPIKFASEVENEKKKKEEEKKKEAELEKQKKLDKEKEIIQKSREKELAEKNKKAEKPSELKDTKIIKKEPVKPKEPEQQVHLLDDEDIINTFLNFPSSNNEKKEVKEVKPKLTSFYDLEPTIKEVKKPKSVNSSFSGDELDQVANQINIEKSEQIPELKIDNERHNDTSDNNILTASKHKDDFIENLFSNKSALNTDYKQKTGYNFNFYDENKVVTSKDIPFDDEHSDFPLNNRQTTQSKYDLDEDDDTPKPEKNEKKDKNVSMEEGLKNTKDMYSYINENTELSKQANNLDTFCNFAVKSLKHLVPKLMNDMDKDNYSQAELNKMLQNTDEYKNDNLNAKDIENTSYEINQLLTQSFSDFKQENKHDETTTNTNTNLDDSFEKPNMDDQNSKLNKFKAFMFNDAKQLNTTDLLGKIVNIIDKEKQNKKILSGEDIESEQSEVNYGTKEKTLQSSNKSSNTGNLIQQMFLASGGGSKPIQVEEVQRMVEMTTNNNTFNNRSRKDNEINEVKRNDKDELHSNYTTNDDVKTKKQVCYRGIVNKRNKPVYDESDDDEDNDYYNQEE